MDERAELYRLLTNYPNGLIEIMDPDSGTIAYMAKWNLRSLSSNIHLPGQYVIDNLDGSWNYQDLIRNSGLEIEVRIAVLRYALEHSTATEWIIRAVDELPLVKELIELTGDQHIPMLLNERNTRFEVAVWLINNNDKYRQSLLNSQSIISRYFSRDIHNWLLEDERFKDLPVVLDEKNRYVWNHQYNPYRLHNLLRVSYPSDEELANFLNDERARDILDCNHIESILTNRRSSQRISLMILESCRSLLSRIPVGNLVNAELAEEVIDFLFSYHRGEVGLFIRNRGITSHILLKLINGEYGAKFGGDVIMNHYAGSNNVIDIRVVERLYQLKDSSSLRFEYPDMIANPNVRWRHCREHGELTYVAMVSDLESLIRLCSSPHYNVIELIQCDQMMEMIQFISDNPGYIRLIDWEYLTGEIDHELIISYPHLPWEAYQLSLRSYKPNCKSMSMKSARR